MLKYIIKRLLMSLLIVWVVTTFSFFVIRLMPGNAIGYLRTQLVKQGGLTPDQINQRLSTVYNLAPHDPLWKQYIDYIAGVAHGDFGTSIVNQGQPVSEILASSIPWTVFVVGVALLISFVIGIAVGTVMAAFQAGWFARVMTFIVSFLSSVPNYLVAILLIYFFASLHPIFPTGAAYSLETTPGWNLPFIISLFYHGLLPIGAYVVTGFGAWALQMKGSVISILGAEYVQAGRAWGLSSRRITQSYVGRNSLLPQVTAFALALGTMFGGSVLVETFFQYPGIGYYLVTAVDSRDYSVMMGCFIVITIAVVLSNLVVDLMYPLIDPRIVSPYANVKADLEEDESSAEPKAAGAI